ncbi:nucleotidyltransferase domain-containing protein [Salinibacterium sp. SWN1162]|uniref:nucleotidyltransferase domain-containing protein n=1 Tax=Salinibacterium sp. SWN1162 TaxID=2792053 RepID=UPI0018CECB40|nr:nucleotidyltransferase domain-containing protein [Salinibacterium sp. SWN1162]MBH0008091.1 nucleotidyltransferase domain-containing protein [Salinibacterium sp. SWN1162]
MDLSNPIATVFPSLDGDVLTVLARTTRPLTGRQVAELAHRGSQSGVRLTLLRLEEQGLVLADSAGRSMLYRANRDHLLWAALEPLLHTAESAVPLLQERIVDVASSALGAQAASATTIALFGSVARGTGTPASDIDLVVVLPDFVTDESGQAAIEQISQAVLGWTGNDCNVFTAKRELLRNMVTSDDPMIESWRGDAVTFNGPELRELIESMSSSHHLR